MLVPFSNGEDNRPMVEVNRCHGPGRGHPCTGPTRTGRARFEAKLVSNLAATSRTAGGVSDVSSAGGAKPELTATGAALAKRTERNVRKAAGVAWQALDQPLDSPKAVERLIVAVANQVSAGLLQPGQGLLRTWTTKNNQTLPGDIRAKLTEFATQLHAKLADSRADPVATAAWVEQRLDGQIHPFADGCGRTTKILSGFVLARAGHALPTYTDRTSYYATINKSPGTWARYYRKLF